MDAGSLGGNIVQRAISALAAADIGQFARSISGHNVGQCRQKDQCYVVYKQPTTTNTRTTLQSLDIFKDLEHQVHITTCGLAR
jgi:hypothetical protein